MRKLCIIIPTYNRHNCIEYYLSCKAKVFCELGVDIIIYDSSSQRKTEQVVNSYMEMGCSNIIYERYLENKEDMSIDHKVYCAYKKYSLLYDYIWFSSDGTVLNVESIFDEISKLMNEKFDMIVVEKTKTASIVKVDITSLFHDHCWSMTLLCSVISSSKIAQEIVRSYPVEKGTDFWLWFPSVYFYIIPNSDYQLVIFQTEYLYGVNANRTDSFWKESGNALWQWCKVWCDVIDKFPEYYDREKNYVIRSHDQNTGIFSIKGLIHLKITGNLTYFKVKQYDSYIKRVTNTKIYFFYLISLFLPRSLLLAVRTCYRKIKYIISDKLNKE